MRSVDYYQVLQVQRADDLITIKRAYRRLARKYHPDQNPDNPAAEEQFKRVVEAWEVLGDPQRRKNYDRWGHADPFQHYAPNAVAIDPFDVLKTAAQQVKARVFRRQGKDLSIRITLRFKEALLGTRRVFEIPRRNAAGNIVRKRFEFDVPRGVGQGRILRWKGYGTPGVHGGEYGNLLVHVAVEAHPIFRFEGAKLFIDMYLSQEEATDGCALDVPTPWGVRTVSIPSRVKDRAIIEGKHWGGLNARDRRDPLYMRVHIEPKDTAVVARKEFYAARARFEEYLNDLRAGRSS